MTPTLTDCIPEQFKFERVKSRQVVVNFKGGAVTSDAGLSLIPELDRKRKITSRFAACFKDYRDVNRLEHSVSGLIAQRVYGVDHGVTMTLTNPNGSAFRRRRFLRRYVCLSTLSADTPPQHITLVYEGGCAPLRLFEKRATRAAVRIC